jgi:hypothetical protein
MRTSAYSPVLGAPGCNKGVDDYRNCTWKNKNSIDRMFVLIFWIGNLGKLFEN